MNSEEYELKQAEKICIFDIDGVLLSCYPQCWVDFVNKNLETDFKNLNALKSGLSYDEYRFQKRMYRLCGIKANLPADEHAALVTQTLKQQGWTIIIVTARPAQDYPCLAEQTKYWLEKNKIVYDFIEFGEKNKRAKVLQDFPHAKFVVEDNSYLANQMAKWGYKVFLVENPYNAGLVLESSIIKIKSLQEILTHVCKD
jgi:uncharacterized HAD superfamily protein